MYPYKDIKKTAVVEQLLTFATDKFRFKTMYCLFQLLIGPAFFGSPQLDRDKQQKFIDGVKDCYQHLEDYLKKHGTKFVADDGKS